MRFNAPPNWPVPPGWAPSPGSDVDPRWPPAPPDWPFWVPDDQPVGLRLGPVGAGATGPGRGLPRWLIAVLVVVLIAGYGLAILVTQSLWNRGQPATAVHASFAVRPLAGSSVLPDVSAKAREILRDRISRLGGGDISVAGDADTVQVSATGVTGDQLRGIAAVGELYIRPVVHAIAARSVGPAAPSTPSPAAPVTDQRIRDEKGLRQSTNPQIQMLALQFQATRCGEPDQLADNDDPNLPLVTCSHDGQQAYVLDKSVVAGDQIKRASAIWDRQQGQYVVDVQFNDDVAARWANFTRDKVGTQVAITVDSQVLSAPVIREAIPSGRAQINGQSAADSARSLAAVLAGGALPVRLTVQSVEVVALHPAFWTTPRIAVAVGAVVVGSMVIVGLVMLGRRRQV